jgi:N-methylhydantoinase A/oxoprolinase/acetone carboxylase beta subunit
VGTRIAGPAIVEQIDTTTVIPPGHQALVDPSGVLRIRCGVTAEGMPLDRGGAR